MKFLTKACFGMLLAASAMSTPGLRPGRRSTQRPAHAQSGGIAVTSDYRFRGVSLSNEKVAVQPTLTRQPRKRPLCRRLGLGRFPTALPTASSNSTSTPASCDRSRVGHDGRPRRHLLHLSGQRRRRRADRLFRNHRQAVARRWARCRSTGMVAYACRSRHSLGDDDNIYLNLGLPASAFPIPPSR
jgi:hypothetical protein